MTQRDKQFLQRIKNIVNEKDVENVYRTELSYYFKDSKISSPCNVDGLLKTEDGKLVLLMEFKHDKNFKSRIGLSEILIQVIYYLKQLEKQAIAPNVVLVADENEFVALNTDELHNYLNFENVNWNTAASSASKNNAKMLIHLSENDKISPFIHNVDNTFSFSEAVEKIKALADGSIIKVMLNEGNIFNAFAYFRSHVVNQLKKLSSNEIVGMFLGILLDQDNYYIHPKKKNLLVDDKHKKEYRINSENFNAFFGHFENDYSLEEKEKLTEKADQLLEDDERRRNGQFFTPDVWVDEAVRLMDIQFPNWRNGLVWDNCAGTNNLTKNHYFDNLYSSTLEEAEYKMGLNYNKNTVHFVYDFLNEEELPKEIIEEMKAKGEITFFINPPYGQSVGFGGKSKAGIAKNWINDLMVEDKIGLASRNLYTQFLYRIMKIKKDYNVKINLGLFSPPLMLTGGSFKKFRERFLKKFKFNNGMLFQASQFADVSDGWGIMFTMFDTDNVPEMQNNFNVDIVESSIDGIKIIDNKDIYNIDYNLRASDWVKSDVQGKKTFDEPQMTSGLTIKNEGKTMSGRLIKGSLGYYNNGANNIEKNTLQVILLSSCFPGTAGFSIIPSNFTKCTSLFTARKSIKPNWINSKDEYFAPNENHELYKNFVANSLVYSIFHSSANQSSMRNVNYKDKVWQIKNEFFPFSNKMMMDLASETNFDDLYYDAKTYSNERHLYKIIEDHKEFMSPIAIELLERFKAMLEITMPIRKLEHELHPEYHLKSWDAGWYQIKIIMKQYFEDQYKDFMKLFKELEDEIIPMVYKVGFLKR